MDLTENYNLLKQRIRNINSTAPIIFSSNGAIDPQILPGFGKVAITNIPIISGEGNKPAHGDGIFEVSRVIKDRIQFSEFEKWLNQLQEDYGANLLRLKGIIHFEGQEAPSLIQAVQHIHYPLETVSLQSGEEIGRLVLIGQEISRHELVYDLEDLARIAYHS